MIRGTTPRHVFSIPFDTSLLKEVMITYAQNDDEVLRKDIGDCTLIEKAVVVELSQEETLKFDHNRNVQIQMRLLTVNDEALASNIVVVSVGNVLNDEVLY